MLSDLLWYAPGFAIALGVSIAASYRVGRALGTRRLLGWGIVMGLGLVLAATFTPQDTGSAAVGVHAIACDFTRLGLAPIGTLLAINEASLNVLMFVPLGATIGLLPRSRSKAVLVAAAIALPFAVEAVQALATVLNRACESADVVDNLTGLVLGLGLGTLVGRFAPAGSDREGERQR
jgi:hypothetical protein